MAFVKIDDRRAYPANTAPWFVRKVCPHDWIGVRTRIAKDGKPWNQKKCLKCGKHLGSMDASEVNQRFGQTNQLLTCERFLGVSVT